MRAQLVQSALDTVGVRARDRRTSPDFRLIEPEHRIARKLRPSQMETFAELRGEDHIILNCPTGWGKTTVLSFLAADRLRRDPTAKVVIIVPQRVIAGGFVAGDRLQFPDGDTAIWEPLDLCGATTSKVDRLVEFLTQPAAGHRVVVTTHAGFVSAYARLGEDAGADFRDIVLIVDESHHVQAGDVHVRNGLGRAVSHLLGTGVALWLATAFFFRGDRTLILEEGHLARFRRVFIPLDVHLASSTHTKEYRYDFVAYKQSVFAELISLLKASQPPTLIYCPQAGHTVLGNLTKDAFVERVVNQLLQHYPGAAVWRPGLGPDARNVILDLAGMSDRGAKVEYIREHGDRIGAILTVGMMKEGADWPPCARVLDLVPSSSDQERNQKFGRLIRDHPGKTTAQYFSFLPLLLDKEDEAHRVLYSRLFAHFHASLILDNALHPIKVPSTPRTPAKGGGKAVTRVDLLGQFPADRQQEIDEAVSASLVSLAAVGEKEGSPLSWEKASGAILDTLRRLECGSEVGEDNLEPLRDQIVLLWRRRKNPTLDVLDLLGEGFDKIWAPDALAPLKLFSAGQCGIHTFAELREVLKVGGQVEADEWARECVTRYKPGQLPSLTAKTSEGRRDAQRITALRMSRQGNGRNIWYPSVEAIFHGAGHVGAFDTTNHQAEAEQWAHECTARYKPGQLPTWRRGGTTLERADGKRIDRLRCAKRGTHGRAMFYPSVEAIFEAAGHLGVFADPTDHQAQAEQWARECVARYEPGELPNARSPIPEARRDGQKIHNLRSARRGTNRGKFYPTVEAIFAAAGHCGVFDSPTSEPRMPPGSGAT